MSAPRRACPVCTREIAVVSGRYARHDPPGRRSAYELVSCPGSLRRAPAQSVAPDAPLFDSSGPDPAQPTLF